MISGVRLLNAHRTILTFKEGPPQLPGKYLLRTNNGDVHHRQVKVDYDYDRVPLLRLTDTGERASNVSGEWCGPLMYSYEFLFECPDCPDCEDDDEELDIDDPTTLQDLAREIHAANQANGWDVTEIHDWKNNPVKLASKMALIHTEVAEATEAIRNDNFTNFIEEMCDTLIRVLDCVYPFTSELDSHVRAKLNKNKGRGHRHGGKRL